MKRTKKGRQIALVKCYNLQFLHFFFLVSGLRVEQIFLNGGTLYLKVHALSSLRQKQWETKSMIWLSSNKNNERQEHSQHFEHPQTKTVRDKDKVNALFNVRQKLGDTQRMLEAELSSSVHTKGKAACFEVSHLTGKRHSTSDRKGGSFHSMKPAGCPTQGQNKQTNMFAPMPSPTYFFLNCHFVTLNLLSQLNQNILAGC